MTSLVPYLLFRDGDTSLRFLHVFGFDVVTEQRDDDGRVAHLELRRGDAVVMGGSATAEQLAGAVGPSRRARPLPGRRGRRRDVRPRDGGRTWTVLVAKPESS